MGPLNLYMHIKNIYHYKLEQNKPVTFMGLQYKVMQEWYILIYIGILTSLQYTSVHKTYFILWCQVHLYSHIR